MSVNRKGGVAEIQRDKPSPVPFSKAAKLSSEAFDGVLYTECLLGRAVGAERMGFGALTALFFVGKEIENMPQQSQRGRIGSSPSPAINKVIQNNVDVQMPVKDGTSKGVEYAKQPIKIPLSK